MQNNYLLNHEYIKKNIIVLPYINISLIKKILDKNSKKISVIVIEPIQCGIPDSNTIKYLNLNIYWNFIF